MNNFQKYICEKGIISLINSYSELLFIDIFNKICNIKNTSMCIYVLTTDHFIRITIANKIINICKIKFSLAEKEFYMNILKESTNNSFISKYKKMFTNKNIILNRKLLKKILQNYDVELYNIKILLNKINQKQASVMNNIFKQDIIFGKLKPNIIIKHESSFGKLFSCSYINIQNLIKK
jgi:hypothetical protein